MASNVSEQLFNAILKANASEKKSGFEDYGISVNWDLNAKVLKGSFSIPVQQILNDSTKGCIVVAQDFLNYNEL